MTAPRQYRAGQSVEDYCRQCHEDRIHTVIVVDGHGQPLRVTCDFCRSEHNYRGGPRSGASKPSPPQRAAPSMAAAPLPLVSERESAFAKADNRQASHMSQPTGTADLELLIRRIIRE